MMQTAAEQLRRILQLIPRLADDRDHAIEDIATQAGIDRKTLMRDLHSLADRFEDPSGFIEGVTIFIDEGQVSVHASHFLRPMRLTPAELGALELGLAMLRAERPPEEHRAIDGARERLRRVIAGTPADLPLAASLGGVDEPAFRARIRAAVRDRRKVRLLYQKAAADVASSRVVCPYATVFATGAWYMVAHCEDSDALRFFRLDRVRGVELLEQRFRRPAGFVVEDLIQDGRAFQAEEAGSLTVRYGPAIARWVAEREGKELEADGSLTLEHPLADVDWAVRHVLQYGPDAEVLSPPAVREAVRDRLRAVVTPSG
jgi:proteasome accessory factor C